MESKTISVFGLAIVIRLCLIAYGHWHDHHMKVRYTDVDYDVYTDAARAVANNESPFQRTTYRYTPLLAYMMLPNIYIHEVVGKLMFVFADLLVGLLLLKILRLRGIPEAAGLKYASIWLFHPFSINVSTRGNADTLIGLMVLLSLYLLLSKQLILGALIYGLAAHFKIYPLVYSLALLVFLNGDYDPSSPGLLNKNRIIFSLLSGGLFLALIAVFYHFYGFEFLYETYLYHFVRTDNRHNFSVFFYELYLRFNTTRGFALGLFAFLPQLAALITVSVRLGTDLPFAFFILTMVFVTFNKVMTAQYFVWYTCLLPLVVATSRIPFVSGYPVMMASWFAGELHWLYWAYYLEFQGVNTFFQLWIAGLIFFIVNISLIVVFINAHEFGSNFNRGKLVKLN